MHGCYNGIGLWFVEGVAGIRVHASESPPLTIRAGVDAGDITHARGHREALHGVASSSWALLPSGQFVHNITVPAGGMAKLFLPSSKAGTAGITESGEPLSNVAGVLTIMSQQITLNKINYVVLTAGSGQYSFQSQWRRVAA